MTALTYLKHLLMPPTGTDDPKQWDRSTKNRVLFVIAYASFLAPLGSSIYYPAVLEMSRDLDTTAVIISLTISVYILVIGLVPVFWASLCDILGRRPIYLISMTIFIFGAVGGALANNIWVFLVMRIVQGAGASSFLSVGGGSLSDVYASHERGTAFGLYYLGPLVGPIAGPVVGGVLSNALGWRSTQWLLFGCGLVALLLVLFTLPETYRPVEFTTESVSKSVTESKESMKTLENHHHDDLHKSPNGSVPTLVSSSGKSFDHHLHASADDQHRNTRVEKSLMPLSASGTDPQGAVDMVAIAETDATLAANAATPTLIPIQKLSFNPLRPLKCLLIPSNFLIIMFNSLALGALASLNNTLPHSFNQLYGLNESLTGLCFISIGAGNVLGSVVGGRYSDYVLARWLRLEKERVMEENRKVRELAGKPEKRTSEETHQDDDEFEPNIVAPPDVRIQSVWIGVVILPLGLISYGWTVQYATSIAGPLISIFFCGLGMMMVYSSTTTVLVDSNSEGNLAAAALSCNAFLRGIIGAVAGVIALPMMDAMGNGWAYVFWACCTILGALSLGALVFKGKRDQKKRAAMIAKSTSYSA